MTKQRRKRKLEDDFEQDREAKKEAKTVDDGLLNKELNAVADKESIGDYTILPTREYYAEQIVILLRSNNIVLVEGDVGSGKTFIGKHVASLLSLPVRVMQMGDQLDSKSLLGAYDCTEVAGHFKWRKSLFQEWLISPGIIVIEDIDLANADVITTLISISSSRQILLPSGSCVHLHPQCYLLATTLSTRLGVRRCGVLEGLHSRVILPSLSDDELKRLGKTVYPRISHIVKAVCKIFRKLDNLQCGGNSRKLTSSDVMRAFRRVNGVRNLSSSQEILLELIDVWVMNEPSNERKEKICSVMASLLSLTSHEVEFSLRMRTPSLHLSENSVNIGRVSLDRRSIISTERSTKLGHTKGALQLLERMAMSVKMCEGVLLVGESGVGKTSLVQVLADMSGEKLSTVNLGPHTDTDDLLTSLRPTSYGRLMEPFTREFIDLFTRSFDPSKNEKFLRNLELYLINQKYDEYLNVVEETAKRILSKKRESEWADVVVRCRRLKEGMKKGASPFALQRGVVKEAAEEGYWLLIDEINLAPPECLDAIVDALSSSHHPSFRLFACMNPATDTAKRRLPQGVRSKFTEYYVSEDVDAVDLGKIVSSYLPSVSVNSVDAIVTLYMDAKKLHPLKLNLRTLTRALVFGGDGRFDNENRCLYEGFSMAFLSNMELDDKILLHKLISSTFPCEKVKQMRCEKNDSILVEGYEIERGDALPIDDRGYVITATVKDNLKEVARIVSSKRHAVLLEGETSAGKTSIVVHLAKITGNTIRRINNHEQTDVQEYIGSYVPDSNGRLYFREGPLVEAVRKGYWVILDELNLAPSDVIETLNRLLDDNRELLISESNEIVRAHPRFRLFATQNPAGSYAGRKRLSRALLSRFVVLLFPILPLKELSQMVCARCQIAPSAADKMIRVLLELRLQRSLSGLFSSKDGLMTLRDVFRWGHRLASDEGSDWQACMLHHGYFLLAGRCRTDADRNAVISTLENVLKGKIDEKYLFSLHSPYFPHDLSFEHVILTSNMRRMLVLSWQAFLRNEAVLIVGETGDGKTRLAQTLGGETMLTINCHERTECSDLLGRLRPSGDGGFEWQDGVVIKAMREGRILLMDEVSLAEDSVLERLNPLFEENRSILLTDSGAQTEEVRAKDTFKVIATMNPGGDYGKKELSKALRNRFTEIWSCSSFDRSELCSIFSMRINEKIDTSIVMTAASIIVDWINRFFRKFSHVLRVHPSVRDIVACAEMWSALCAREIDNERALVETLSSVFIDGIPCQLTRAVTNISEIQQEALQMIEETVRGSSARPLPNRQMICTDTMICIGDLFVPFGPLPSVRPRAFSFSAPTCMENMYRVIRALYINKPILLEGSPGCGKSSLVMALASIAGYPITRLNLSEQTDLSDLFGSDVPIVDGDGKMSFEWRDGPILKAIKNGEWILLDEMNLASQSILEGLNACFDHRRVIYIAELAKEFSIPSSSSCRFFACQNPRGEGGNRRALPKSFVNRFTNIYTRDLTDDDELAILKEMNYSLGEDVLSGIVKVNQALASISWSGGPFSFNLRDINRWMHMISQNGNIGSAFETVYVKRLRTEEEKERARAKLKEIMHIDSHSCSPFISIDEKTVRIGSLKIERRSSSVLSSLYPISSQASTLLSVLNCLSHGWITLLVGSRNSGKRSISEMAASLIGLPLQVISLSNDTDASELIGSFEQKVEEGAFKKMVDSLCDLLSPYIDTVDRLKECTQLDKLESDIELLLTNDEICDEVRGAVNNLLTVSFRSEMHFEWVDSAFVRAYTQGECILIENVNLCNSAVLDRLNTSLETGGSLVLSESRGNFQPIAPHPNFRVILSMDSCEGEISRAMRNRSVEIFMDDENGWNGDERDIHTIISSLSGKNIISRELCCALVGLPSRTILFSGLILSQFEEGSVAKLANRCIDDKMSDERMEAHVRMPPLNEWRDIETMSEWILSMWKEASNGDRDMYSLPLLPLLAASVNTIRSKAWERYTGERGMRFVENVSYLLPSLPSNHPIDPSFYGDHSCSPLHSLCSSILVQWLYHVSSFIENEEWSALTMASSLSLYEMTASPFYFERMESSGQILEKIMENFSKVVSRMNIQSEVVFPISLFILSLHRALSRSMSVRSGDSRIRIAYSNLLKMVHNESTSVWIVELEEWVIPNAMEEWLVQYNEHRIMDPLTHIKQLENMKENVTRLREVEEMTVWSTESIFTRVVQLGRKIEKSMSLNGSTNHIICMNNQETGWMRVMECLPWKKEDESRKGVIACLLSSDLCEDLPLSSLLFSSPVSLMISTVWNNLGWDSHMRRITVRNLRDLSYESFLSQLWRIGCNSRTIDATIRKSAKLIGIDGIDSSSFMSYGLNMMEETVPPLSSLDPVIYEEENREIVLEQWRIVEGLIESLCQWRRLVAGRSYMIDESSTHPFTKSLYRMRNKLKEKMMKIEIGEEKISYREESKEYSVMCREMHSLLTLCCNVYELVSNEKWKESQDFDLMRSHVVNARKSAKTFLEDSLLRFGSLIDVMGRYWNGVWIVYLSLNMLHYEMALHSTRLSLISSTAFPRVTEPPIISWLGPLRNVMINWAIRASSPLPIDLQSALIEWKVSKGESGHLEIEWTRSQWKKWYEKNTTYENKKLFEYREKTMEEKENVEMEEIFGALELIEGEEKVVGDDTLILLLDAFTGESIKKKAFEKGQRRLVTAIAYLTSLCNQCGIRDKWNNAGLDASLYAFSSLYGSKDSIVDVYRESSWNEVKEALEECMKLKQRTDELKDKWPEVQSLSLIMDAIESLMDSSLSIGQMKMAERIEKIIEEAEEWEKMADRSHSLECALSPLRERLVGWKKMEIVSWNKLVHRVKQDCEDRAALVAFPLFEALLNDDTLDDCMVAMASDWIAHSSLIDFNQRLKSIKCLGEWARVKGNSIMHTKLLNVVGYFNQISSKVNEKLKDIMDPIERLMKDLVKIAQYKDLNILSIKASSKKNHIQLFKLVKKLKNEGGTEMSSLMDQIIDIEEWKVIEKGNVLEELGQRGNFEVGIVKRAREICVEIVEMRIEALDCSSWIEMGESIYEARKHCGMRIEYNGDEKEMESQQGRERNSRQREVALVIKESQRMGITSRRGMTLNGEDISRKSLTELRPFSEKKKNIVRAVGLARSILIRRGMHPNEQLSTSTRGHFLGMVDYGCHWLIMNENVIDNWKKTEKELMRIEKCLRNEMENKLKEVYSFNHTDAIKMINKMENFSNQLTEVLETMKMRLTTVPSTISEYEDACWSPLSRLSSSSQDFDRINKLVDDMHNISERICCQVNVLAQSGRCGIFVRSTIEFATQLMDCLLEELIKGMDDSKYWFDEESDVLYEIVTEMISINKNIITPCERSLTFSIPTEPFLLFIQRLYKSTVERKEIWNGKDIDRLSTSSSTIIDARLDEVITLLASAVDRVSNGDRIENIDVVTQLLGLTRSLVWCCVTIHERCSHGVAIMIHRVVELGIHLMEKGYLNTIPKENKEEEGEGREVDGDGGGGMGEGKGAKDVTEEMEETGQIEGLQGDEEEEDTGDHNGKSDKNERPIEMEEDFAKDLEDVDKEGESGDEEGEDGEDLQIDDGMGVVDEKEEEEIDPHLWDENEKEQMKENTMDDGNKGADEQTGEMAASEDKDAEMGEDEKKDEDIDIEENEKNEEDNVDMENMDKNDRENKEEMEGTNKEEDNINELEDHSEDESELGEKTVDGDENAEGDEERENEDGDKKEGDEENIEKDEEDTKDTNDATDVQMLEENEEEGENEKNEEMEMDTGFGAKRNEDEEKMEGKGAKEDENEENNGDDERGENMDNINTKKRAGNKDEKAGEEDNCEKNVKEEGVNDDDDDYDDGEKETKRDTLNEDEKQIEERQEFVDGTEEENGEERKESMNKHENDRMMIGAGTMEEAKDSMKSDRKKTEEKNKETVQRNNGEMVTEENDEEGVDSVIVFNPLDLMTLTEKMAKELIMSGQKEEDVVPHVKESTIQEKTEEEISRCRMEWERMAPVVSLLAAELSENLRLILEPRLATKMEGDYRSGKRLNMKRIIPYIASQYRKNRIWMRRTKKADRNYEVLIAVDDSASMAENGMETLTCQGVCIVEEALRRVNAGQLSLLTFGETIEQLIPFAHASSTQSTGESILSSLSFNQSSTDMCGMLRKAATLLEEIVTPKSEQMLIIISDGRGALANGIEKIREELARLSQVTVLFVILDCGKKSIREMKVASFVDDQVQLMPYLTLFPFPLYVLAQSATQIPSLLAEALRQWIEFGSQ